MATSLNSAGAANARSKVGSGDVDKTSGWSFSAEDGNALLGTNGDDWANYAKWFLGVHSDQPEKTKGHYGYPFGKGGKVYRSGLIAAKQRAAQQGDSGVEAEAGALVDKIDGKAVSLTGKDVVATCDYNCPNCGAKACGKVTCSVCNTKGMVGQANCAKCVGVQMADAAKPAKSAIARAEAARKEAWAKGTMRPAWATLELKAAGDNGLRTFEGTASTPETDRQGDVVEPMGAKFTLPIPLLWQHESKDPIGYVTEAKVSKNGITVKGYVEQLSEPPSLKDDLDRAWAMIKSKLVRGLSIGFVPLDMEPLDAKNPWGGTRFLSWDWLELSAVTIPANAGASISTIKSIDKAQLAASGQGKRGVVTLSTPGASGRNNPQTPKGNAMERTLQERISAAEAKRAADVARMKTIMDEADADGGRTMNETETQEYDGLEQEVEALDQSLVRLKKQEALMLKSATTVAAPAANQAAPAFSGIRLESNKNLPKGIGFARYVKSLAYGKGNYQAALEYAKQWDTSTPDVTLALKSAIAAGTTADSTWAGPLVYNQNLVDEFVEFLRPQTILGKMNGFRRVPFNVRFPTQTAGSTVGWVGEGAAKPVSKLALSSGTLGWAKAAGIVVITQELARFSSPSAEMLVRDDVTAQMVYFLDQQFIDPGVAAVANTNPASVTNGAGNVVQSGAVWNTQANVIADIKSFLQAFATANIALDSSTYWIMTPAVAISLSMIVTANGVYAFPDINVNGGTLYGIPVITSNSVPSSVSAGSIVALVKASEIFLADDNQVAIDVSQEASLQMDSAPTENSTGTPTATTVVSMFQTNSLAIRVERIINWQRRRSYGAGYLDNVHTS